MKSPNEDTMLHKFESMPKHQLSDVAKQRMLSEFYKKKGQSNLRSRFPRWIGSTVATVAAISIVAGVIYGVSYYKKPVTSSHTTAVSVLPQAETSFYQKFVNQMTPTQKSKLHQLLTRDTQIADLWIYDGNTNPALVTQMESDFKEFQSLFPQQMASIKSQPALSYAETSQYALFPFVTNDFTSFLSEIYLAYEAAIWNMGNPNVNLVNQKLTHLVQRRNVPGIFSQWDRVFFGGRIDINTLTK